MLGLRGLVQAVARNGSGARRQFSKGKSMDA